jgi:hypothetical protein
MYTLANSIPDLTLTTGAGKTEAMRTFTDLMAAKVEATRVSSTMDKIRGKLQKGSKDVCRP